MKKRCLCLLVFFGAAAAAQTASFSLPLKQFLDLTDAQVLMLVKISDAFSQTVREKQIRITQLQFEINDQTAKDPIDPMELGVRYAEIAQIQKDLRSQQTAVRAAVRQVLTDAQRAKVKMLDDAAKLQPLISEAVCVGFIDSPPPTLPALRISAIGIGAGGYFSVPGFAFGCPGGTGFFTGLTAKD